MKTSLEDKETNVREFERLAGRLAEISTENADLKAALDARPISDSSTKVEARSGVVAGDGFEAELLKVV